MKRGIRQARETFWAWKSTVPLSPFSHVLDILDSNDSESETLHVQSIHTKCDHQTTKNKKNQEKGASSLISFSKEPI